MNRKDVIKNLEKGAYIKRDIIGYGIDTSVIYSSDGTWLSVLKPIQVTSMLEKYIIRVENSKSSNLNGIGGKMMDTKSITYVINEVF